MVIPQHYNCKKRFSLLIIGSLHLPLICMNHSLDASHSNPVLLSVPLCRAQLPILCQSGLFRARINHCDHRRGPFLCSTFNSINSPFCLVVCCMDAFCAINAASSALSSRFPNNAVRSCSDRKSTVSFRISV